MVLLKVVVQLGKPKLGSDAGLAGRNTGFAGEGVEQLFSVHVVVFGAGWGIRVLIASP